MTSQQFISIFLPLTGLLVACSGEQEDTDLADTGPEDTGWPEAELEVQTMSFELTEAGVDLSFTTTGWATNARFNAYNTNVSDPQTNGWDEEHVPQSTAQTTQFDPEGVTETRALFLEHVSSIMYWKSDETTLFNVEDEGSLTFALRVYDGDEALAQCLVWGHSPGTLYAGTYSKVNITSEPTEFNSTNCAAWTE